MKNLIGILFAMFVFASCGRAPLSVSGMVATDQPTAVTTVTTSGTATTSSTETQIQPATSVPVNTVTDTATAASAPTVTVSSTATRIDTSTPTVTATSTVSSIPQPATATVTKTVTATAITTVVNAFQFCSVDDSTVTRGCCAIGDTKFKVGSFPPSVGSLIRGTTYEAIYYYASDGKRYVFNDDNVLVSWYATGNLLLDTGSDLNWQNICGAVYQLSDVDLASIPIGGNVTVRPGTYILHVQSTQSLYVVSRNKTLRKLASPNLVAAIFPDNHRTRWLPEAFFVNYNLGADVVSVSDYDPAAEYDWAAPDTMETELGIKLPLTVRVADDTPAPLIITANTVDNTITRIEFSGADEPLLVTKATFAIKSNNNASIVSLRIFDNAGSLFCSGAIDDQGHLMCANDVGLFTINGTTKITLKVNVDQVDSEWASSGDTFQGAMEIVTTAKEIRPFEYGSFVAVGIKTGKRYMPHEAIANPGTEKLSYFGNVMTLRKTQPFIATVAVSEKLENGERVVYKFTVTASSNADVGLRQFTLGRDIFGVITEMYYLYENGNPVAPFTISATISGRLVVDFGEERIIAAGMTKTYEVRASLAGANAGSFITHYLVADTQDSSYFQWSDNSADAHSLTSEDWWNGNMVNGLPTAVQILSQ